MITTMPAPVLFLACGSVLLSAGAALLLPSSRVSWPRSLPVAYTATAGGWLLTAVGLATWLLSLRWAER